MQYGSLIISEDEGYGRIVGTPGVSYGYGAILKLLLKKGNLLFIKVPGASDWSGRGETSYSSPYVMVAKVKRMKKGNDDIAGEYEVIESKDFEYDKSTRKEVFAKVGKEYGVKLSSVREKSEKEKQRIKEEKKVKEERVQVLEKREKEEERKCKIKKEIIAQAMNLYLEELLMSNTSTYFLKLWGCKNKSDTRKKVLEHYSYIKELMQKWNIKIPVTKKEVLKALNMKE